MFDMWMVFFAQISKIMHNHSGLGVPKGIEKYIPPKANLVSPTGDEHTGVCTQTVAAMWFRSKYKELKYAMRQGC